MHNKLSRNEPCPCGSGLKYKKCCLKSRQDFDTFKMSEIIQDFAQELLIEAKNLMEHNNAIMFACFAWNLALLDVSEHQPLLDTLVASMALTDEQDKQDLYQLIYDLVAKKHREYAWCQRYIINHQVDGSYEDPLLHVASVDATHMELKNRGN